MPNYEMKFGVSETAKYLDTDRDLIKKWAYLFSDYLEPEANPLKGTPRQFSAEDLRVFAYISYYWEDDPDIESIKDKRKIVSSLKRKLQTKYHLSVAEVDLLDSLTFAHIGAAMVTNSKVHGEKVLQKFLHGPFLVALSFRGRPHPALREAGPRADRFQIGITPGSAPICRLGSAP